jgi:energy-coupling factor transporter ATP-binding protein EcfA2
VSLAQVRVKNFQSIKSATIPIGGLTVVVGESNVGKSALVRALALLTRNGASTGLVRKGADNLAVAALFQDGTAIQVRRGPKLSEFKIRRGDQVETYTKCGTGVPEEVTRYWALASTDLGELSFHGQHDPPFLLSQPASSVARQIGAITNAHLLNDAVRETNRRRLEATQEVRSFTREAEECREALAGVGDLKARKAAIQRVQEALNQATAASQLAQAARAVYDRARVLDDEIRELESVTGPSEVIAQKVAEAEAAVKHSQRAKMQVRMARENVRQIAHEDSAAREWAHGALQIEQDAHRMLVELGRCPACGQEVA